MPVAAGVVGDTVPYRRSSRSARHGLRARHVRQRRSIAGITFNWPRLTWPALALRHAGPCLRKISATSKAGARHALALQVGGLLSLSLSAICASGLITLLDRLGGDARVERRGVELGRSEQHLDHPNIDILLQKMGGKAVPQRMRRNVPVDSGRLCSGSGRRDWVRSGCVVIGLTGVLTGKQPALGPRRPPPGAQQFEQAWRGASHCGPCGLLPCSTRTIIRLLSMSEILSETDFRHAQAGPIGHAQRRQRT